MVGIFLFAAALLAAFVPSASAQYQGWQQSGALTILTTPEGANIPAGSVVQGFPLLVRLNKETFDFSKAQPHGDDVRFATADGAALPYEIEDWDAAGGSAAVWVRVPKIAGNARQELRMFWGKADAKSESSGKAVFNESNGFLSVWHLGDTVADEVGTLDCKDAGTTQTAGMMVTKGDAFSVANGIAALTFCNVPIGGAAK